MRAGIPKSGTIRNDVPNVNMATADADGIKPFAEEKPKIQAADIKVLKKEIQTAVLTDITLNGVTYSIDGLVSASTGEAEVYRIVKGANTYALKLYYAGTAPDPKVIEILKRISGTGFLVDIIDYGTWSSPQGDVRYFELMPFYTGGELKPGMFKGNPDALKATAAAMMMAVKVAHDHNILHKDIKPQNFIYADESRTQLMLTDFGIASTFQRDGNGRMQPLKMHDQSRTKEYAAPEIYTVIDNEIEYPDDRSDYYSLGVALLTLWAGDKELMELMRLGERKLLSLKRNESGTLPYPQDMPAQLLTLIKGLTVPVSGFRWGFDEFERWVKGENVPVHGLTPDNQPTASGINILYNGSKGQRATSLPELAALMMADTRLAAQYLYSGQISRWIKEAGYPEIEAQIGEFVTSRYPANREAGVLATAYLLDVDMPFIGPTGNRLSTQEEIAHDMTRHAVKYLPMMSDKDAPLYIYFRSGGIEKFAQFQQMARKGQMDAFKAMWRMIYTLDPSAQFPVYDPRTPDKYYTYDTIDQIVDFFSKLPANPYDNNDSAIPHLLYDEAFIMWLAYRNEPLAGKIKSKLAQENHKSPQLYYYVWYLLATDRNFDLQKDQTRMFTIAQIAERINGEYVGMEQSSGLVDMLQDLKDNRLYYYMKSKELYKKTFDYVAYCFDFDSKDRRNQAGPYDHDIATFKAIKAISGDSFYFFPISRQIVKGVEELDKVDATEQSHEVESGLLREWLAVEYQEDPFADLSEEYAYESLLANYTSKLCEINDDLPVLERFNEATEAVGNGASKIKRMLRSNYIWRGIFCLVVALPLLGLAALSIFGDIARFTHPSGLIAWGIIALVFTVGLRIIQIFPKIDEWLLQPFGEQLGDTLLLHRWVVSAIYAAAIAGICWMMETYNTIGQFVIPVLCVALLVWRYKVTIGNYPLMRSRFNDVINPDVEADVIEPLYYAWHNEEDEFDSETLDRQKTYYDGIKSARYFCITRTLWSLIPIALLVAIYIPFSPMCEQYIKDTDPQKWERVYGEGLADDKADTPKEMYYANVKSSLIVRAEPSASAPKLGAIGKGEQFEVLSVTNGFAMINYGNGVGYVNVNYIKPVDNPEATAISGNPDE